MKTEERELDLALAEAESENRLLRARNERLEKVVEAAKTMVGVLNHMADFEDWDKALTRLEKALEGA